MHRSNFLRIGIAVLGLVALSGRAAAQTDEKTGKPEAKKAVDAGTAANQDQGPA